MQILRDKNLGDPGSTIGTMDRPSFRVPLPFFVQLVAEVKQQGWLGTGGADAADRAGIPLRVKVLSVLCILGKGTALNNMFFFIRMSEST
ncbi:unnamed protein product, partial [Discosporangium mesarthrocarpum]